MDACAPPIHRFPTGTRTCGCGAVTVPDPENAYLQGMARGLARRNNRHGRALGNLHRPKGKRPKPPPEPEPDPDA